jgi:hypothetical protein
LEADHFKNEMLDPKAEPCRRGLQKKYSLEVPHMLDHVGSNDQPMGKSTNHGLRKSREL